MKHTPFVIERTFDAPIGKVWRAITDKNQMKQWYFDIPEFKPEVGTQFQFYGGTEEKRYLHVCKVTEVVRHKRLRYSWRFDGYEGDSVVTFELSQQGGKTKLMFTHEGLDTFPVSNPDLARENFVEGWTAIIGSSLKEFLETNRHGTDSGSSTKS